MIASIVWDVDPILFKVGSWEVRWYGLMWGLGFILAYEIVSRLFKKEKYPEDWVDKLFVYCIVSTVIGARLGHCLFYEWDYYSAHPVEIFKIWKGGLASHGGVFAIILALMWYSKKVIDGKEYDCISEFKDWKFNELTDEDVTRPNLCF